MIKIIQPLKKEISKIICPKNYLEKYELPNESPNNYINFLETNASKKKGHTRVKNSELIQSTLNGNGKLESNE